VFINKTCKYILATPIAWVQFPGKCKRMLKKRNVTLEMQCESLVNNVNVNKGNAEGEH